MIDINFTGMCENCKCADLKLDCMEYQGLDGYVKEWTVRCIHANACDAMEDRMIERYGTERRRTVSVIVKNMEMPKECCECPLWEYRHGIGTTWCVPTKTLLAENYMPIAFDGRHPDCPLVEVEDEEDGEKQ